MKYERAERENALMREIVQVLELRHIDLERVLCFKSSGSKTRRTIARIHGLSKVMQLGLNAKPFYAIELISKRFDRQSEEEQVKTLIHELLHIPSSFGGGFRPHKPFVNEKRVEVLFKEFARKKNSYSLSNRQNSSLHS